MNKVIGAEQIFCLSCRKSFISEELMLIKLSAPKARGICDTWSRLAMNRAALILQLVQRSRMKESFHNGNINLFRSMRYLGMMDAILNTVHIIYLQRICEVL